MVLEKREEVKKIFEDFLDDSLLRIILSNPAFKAGYAERRHGFPGGRTDGETGISPKSDERRRRILLAGTDGERF